MPYLSQIKPFLQTVLLATVNAGSEEEKNLFQNIRQRRERNGGDTVKAEIFVHNLISYILYFCLKVRNLVAHKNYARIPVYVTPSSLYENL